MTRPIPTPFWSSKMNQLDIESCVIGAARLNGSTVFGSIGNVFRWSKSRGLQQMRRGFIGIKENKGRILYFIPTLDYRRPLNKSDFYLLGRINRTVRWQMRNSNIIQLKADLQTKKGLIRDKVDTKDSYFLFVFDDANDVNFFIHHLGSRPTMGDFQGRDPDEKYRFAESNSRMTEDCEMMLLMRQMKAPPPQPSAPVSPDVAMNPNALFRKEPVLKTKSRTRSKSPRRKPRDPVQELLEGLSKFSKDKLGIAATDEESTRALHESLPKRGVDSRKPSATYDPRIYRNTPREYKQLLERELQLKLQLDAKLQRRQKEQQEKEQDQVQPEVSDSVEKNEEETTESGTSDTSPTI